MEFSVIITCYNTLELIQKTLSAVLNSTNRETEIIMVNNNPPYPEVISFLQNLKHPQVKVVDPGCNLGPFDGQQYGRYRAKGKYLAHVDDDTIVPQSDWLEAMRNALMDHNNLAYVSLPWQPAGPTQINKASIFEGSNYKLAVCRDVDVPCTLIEAGLWKREFSKLKMYKYYFGTYDMYYQKTEKIGKKCGYIISHWAAHLGRTPESDLLYGAWKVLYAYKITLNSYEQWREKEYLNDISKDRLLKFGYQKKDLIQMENQMIKIKEKKRSNLTRGEILACINYKS